MRLVARAKRMCHVARNPEHYAVDVRRVCGCVAALACSCSQVFWTSPLIYDQSPTRVGVVSKEAMDLAREAARRFPSA